ncbi:uncharacterized protein LOC117173099 [Belonocnema kinseyi]|uniref:uncharacterized protein LOC117173099 n=1 Tax=Belonocnema kinseyi TaxID=2817044 RepID=UPI00143DE5C0|nr:uncharacterized protein LOC117173099 [Belonocnema kinseyi]
MAIISGILPFLFVGALYFTSVAGYRGYRYRDAVEVKMEDNSKYRGNLFTDFVGIPPWLHPGFAEHATHYEVFVRLRSYSEYYTQLEPYHLLDDHNRFIHIPRYAEMLFIKQTKTYFIASEFVLFNTTEVTLINMAAYPPPGFIYVVKPRGPVYTAAIERSYAIEAIGLGRYQ